MAEEKDRLERARLLIQAGEMDQAWKLCEDALLARPNDALWLITATTILDNAKHLTHAYQYAKRAVDIAPNTGVAWLNFGRVSEELWRLEEAEAAYEKALKLVSKPSEKAHTLINMGALYVSWGEWEKAEQRSREALEIEPDSRKAQSNLGMALLAQRRWEEGWKLYGSTVGSPHRKRQQYVGEPMWDGTKGQRIVVYGEQGLGDEICFASMVPDAMKDAQVILDCDKRLEGLFRRSFPGASVYGTRYSERLDWPEYDRKIDASIPAAQLGEFYRQSTSRFPGTPYLKADSDRVAMWKSLWATKEKPVIGIAWTGGVPWTAKHLRTLQLRQMDPILSSLHAHWVSLQYKDSEAEIEEYRQEFGVDIKQYPYATLTDDYDDTAALVASLDAVVAINTSVIHLAGALGVPVHVIAIRESQWRYTGPDIPWYKSAKLYIKKDKWPFSDVIKGLHDSLC